MSQTVQPAEVVSASVPQRTDAAAPGANGVVAVRRELWLGRSMPWLVSAAVHLTVLAVGAFLVIVVIGHTKSTDDADQIIIPASFMDPALSTGKIAGVPSDGLNDDSSRDAEQQKMRDVLKNEEFTPTQNVNVADLLRGQNAKSDVDLIASGGGGAHVSGKGDEGVASPYGAPSMGAEAGPRTNFLGSSGNARRIVYLIDRTGSLLDSFGRSGDIEPGTVKEQVQRSVMKLLPVQFFALVVFTGREEGGATVVGPPQLLRATMDNKQLVLKKLRDDVVAQGGDSENEILFVDAFRTALALKPQLIFFMTDGDMSPKVLEQVRQLNADHAVKINTIVFTHEGAAGATAEDKQRIAQLAKQNGGLAEVVTVQDLH